MAQLLSEAGGILLELLGNPPREVLDEQGAVQFALEAMSFYKHKLGATGHLLTGTFFYQNANQREFELNEAGFSRAIYAQVQSTGPSDTWERVELVGVADIDNAELRGEYAMAIFGDPPTVRLSWDPADGAGRLRIWHDANAEEQLTLDEESEPPLNIMKYMIARRGALLALPRLMIKAPSVFTLTLTEAILRVQQTQVVEYEEQFDDWRFNREGEGWSQVEGFDEQPGWFGGARRRRFF
jgi:hypothetical protein